METLYKAKKKIFTEKALFKKKKGGWIEQK